MAKGTNIAKPRGRPPLPPGKAKRHNVGIRTTKEIKALLKAAADSSGRSVAQEIERRLERSFDFGGPQTESLLRGLAAVAMAAAPNDDWIDDWRSRRVVILELKRHLDLMDTERSRRDSSTPLFLAEMLRFDRETGGASAARNHACILFRNYVNAHYSQEEQREFFAYAKEIAQITEDEIRSSLHKPLKVGGTTR